LLRRTLVHSVHYAAFAAIYSNVQECDATEA